MLIVFALALASPVVAGEPMACPSPTHYDGDDIRCDSDAWRDLAGKGGMRLGKIDAPEIRCSRKARAKACHKAAALASRDHLRSLTAKAKVTCEWTGERTGVHSGMRPVVMCKAAGSGDLSCRQWRSGNASYIPRFDPKKRFKKRCKR